MTRRHYIQTMTMPNNWDRAPLSIIRSTNQEFQDALEKLARYRSLSRRPGGYWTFDGVGEDVIRVGDHCSYKRPQWYAPTPIVRALIERGWASLAEDRIRYIPREDHETITV
jgi:hypothetical protein